MGKGRRAEERNKRGEKRKLNDKCSLHWTVYRDKWRRKL